MVCGRVLSLPNFVLEFSVREGLSLFAVCVCAFFFWGSKVCMDCVSESLFLAFGLFLCEHGLL